jgi:hypothetical protein
VWIGILIFTATYSQNWFKLRNFSRNLWLGNHFFHQYLSSPHLLYHLNRTCLFSRDLLKYMRCFNLKVVIELLGFYLPLHCLLSRFHTALDCLFLSLFFFLRTIGLFIPMSLTCLTQIIMAGKRRREKKDQKLQSRTKLSRNLMETFIP